MAILTLFNQVGEVSQRVTETANIQTLLAQRGVMFDQWEASCVLAIHASQEEILSAYQARLAPYMEAHGYQSADVINVHADTPHIEALREKFIQEHTHAEDEIRFFVEGRGYFWFRFQPTNALPHLKEEIACVVCEAGDFIAVPAGYTHWFEMDTLPKVKVIRIFSDTSGWVPHYTHSHIEARYQLAEKPEVAPKSYDLIVMDIEGTLTDISFVHDMLFPYAKEHLRAFLQAPIASVYQTTVAEALELTYQTLRLEQGLSEPTLEAAIQALETWIHHDRKHTGLKLLQGCLWEKGYQEGAYQGHVYPEVLPCLQAWQRMGLSLGIYSSGSVQAQKLLFRHSIEGDMTPLFQYHFDTQLGAKQEVMSYEAMVQATGVQPQRILFLSDSIAELEAAHQAGLATVQLCRDDRTVAHTATTNPLLHHTPVVQELSAYLVF
ncbi:MAG: acireductone synthase [Vampirovibrionales bacterium]